MARNNVTHVSTVTAVTCFLLLSGAISCSCVPEEFLRPSCDSGKVELHGRPACEIGTRDSSYARFYEVEGIEVIWNQNTSLELAADELVSIQTPLNSAACGQSLQPDTEYLLYLNRESYPTSLGFPFGVEEPASTGASKCGEMATLETLRCNGNRQVPPQADLAKARSICSSPVSEPPGGANGGEQADIAEPTPAETGVLGVNGASALEDLPSIVAALCIVLIGVFRLAAFQTVKQGCMFDGTLSMYMVLNSGDVYECCIVVLKRGIGLVDWRSLSGLSHPFASCFFFSCLTCT